jgi:hypothetical protein
MVALAYESNEIRVPISTSMRTTLLSSKNDHWTDILLSPLQVLLAGVVCITG